MRCRIGESLTDPGRVRRAKDCGRGAEDRPALPVRYKRNSNLSIFLSRTRSRDLELAEISRVSRQASPGSISGPVAPPLLSNSEQACPLEPLLQYGRTEHPGTS